MTSDGGPGEEYDVEIGYVLGPRGEEGAVVVQSLSDAPRRLAELRQAWLQPRVGAGYLCRILEVLGSTNQGHLVMRIEGVTTAEAADKLRGAVLRGRAQDSPPLPEGTYYVHQILGLEVFTTDGRRIGVIEEIVPTGANDCYRVGECLIPAVKQVVVEVDLEAGRMIIEPLPGLLDGE